MTDISDGFGHFRALCQAVETLLTQHMSAMATSLVENEMSVKVSVRMTNGQFRSIELSTWNSTPEANVNFGNDTASTHSQPQEPSMP